MTPGVFFVGVSLGCWEQTAQKAGNGLVGEGRAEDRGGCCFKMVEGREVAEVGEPVEPEKSLPVSHVPARRRLEVRALWFRSVWAEEKVKNRVALQGRGGQRVGEEGPRRGQVATLVRRLAPKPCEESLQTREGGGRRGGWLEGELRASKTWCCGRKLPFTLSHCRL